MIPAKMRELAETELAKMYRQWARGRAIVQTNCMKNARRLKMQIDKGGERYGAEFFPLSKSELFLLRIKLDGEVHRARKACKDWRKYRAQMHASIKEGL